jgi:ABC-type multidrug transport system fused ATPase/permease subunit
MRAAFVCWLANGMGWATELCGNGAGIVLKRAWGYFSGSWRPVIGGLVLVILVAALELALPWPVKWLVDSVFGSQPLPALVACLPGLGSGASPADAITAIALLVALLGVLHKVLSMWSQFLLIKAGNRVVCLLRMKTMQHVHRLPLAYHDRSRVGDLIYRACYDSYALQTLLSQVLVPVFSGICLAAGLVVVMLRIDVLLTLVTVATAPFFWINLKRFKHRIGEHSRRFHESESAIASQVQESLSSVRVMQAFSLEQARDDSMARQAGVSVEENLRKSVTELGFALGVGMLMSVGTAAVIWLGARGVVDGRLYLGDVLVFLAYLATLYVPIQSLSQGASAFHSASAQLKRVFELLDEPRAVADAPDAVVLANVRGALCFDHVSFAYEPGRPAIKEVSLEIAPGEVCALVGKSGSGKSTLASLLLRLYDPDEGSVRLDGHDLRSLNLSWLRRQVSIVFQEPLLFSATIAENIGLGMEGADRAGIEAAAKRAHAHAFITQLPDGYDTLLGERGVNLSGGQRQRLSIARAFLKDAPILVLDEPTSALDVETEGGILKALRELMDGRTVVIIAHRQSAIRNAERIVVIDEGRIVEAGTHEELIRAHGPYFRLHSADSGPVSS